MTIIYLKKLGATEKTLLFPPDSLPAIEQAFNYFAKINNMAEIEVKALLPLCNLLLSFLTKKYHFIRTFFCLTLTCRTSQPP